MGNAEIVGRNGANRYVYLKRVHETLFSLNIGLTGIFALFAYAPNSVVGRLNQMDGSISTSLNITKTDWATHYFIFFLLSVALAACVWTLLRVFSETRLAKEILRSMPVVFALAILPAMRINPWSNEESLRKIVFPLEILSVLYFAFRYLQGKRPGSTWIIAVIIAAHFVLWSREFGPYEGIHLMLFRLREFRAYMLFVPDGAPVAWTLALCSALVWVLYVDASPVRAEPNGSPRI